MRGDTDDSIYHPGQLPGDSCLSTAYRVARKGGDVIANDEKEYCEGPPPLRTALSKLSDDELKQLIGWTWFGRDYPESKNPEEDFAPWRTLGGVGD